MLEINENFGGDWPLDIVTLLAKRPDDDYWWSAPRWIVAGDLMWMYHTSRGASAVRELQRKFQRDPVAAAEEAGCSVRYLHELLEYAAELSARFARSIFACVEVVDSADKFKNSPPGKHHSGKMYAPIGRVHALDAPISLDRFSCVVNLAKGGAYTPVGPREFDGLKQLVEEDNQLPRFVHNARGGDFGFRDIDSRNWWDRACRPDVRFLHEKQVRMYLADFLLDALRDRRTPILEECDCLRGKHHTGIVDYVVRIHGLWTPVEAKFDVAHEHDLPGQMEKYLSIHSCSSRQGKHAGVSVEGPWADRCLVVDRNGLYIGDEHGLTVGRVGAPAWPRTSLAPALVSRIRSALAM